MASISATPISSRRVGEPDHHSPTHLGGESGQAERVHAAAEPVLSRPSSPSSERPSSPLNPPVTTLALLHSASPLSPSPGRNGPNGGEFFAELRQTVANADQKDRVTSTLSSAAMAIRDFLKQAKNLKPQTMTQLQELKVMLEEKKKQIKTNPFDLGKIEQKLKELGWLERNNVQKSIPEIIAVLQLKAEEQLQAMIDDLNNFFDTPKTSVSYQQPSAPPPQIDTVETDAAESRAIESARNAFNANMQMRSIAATVAAVVFVVLGFAYHPAFFAVAWVGVEYRDAAHQAQTAKIFKGKILFAWSPLLRITNFVFFSVIKKHFQFVSPITKPPSLPSTNEPVSTAQPLQQPSTAPNRSKAAPPLVVDGESDHVELPHVHVDLPMDASDEGQPAPHQETGEDADFFNQVATLPRSHAPKASAED